ncbi:MAG TPA: beta-ketoacyl-ACP synthase III [Bacteroidales bacterium]|jgi:3-oxoacyl-[acyl-carrier-protein] synthase-3|nr:ketoacyl-ACP synthase III [Bacteroidales bacterium]HOB27284.1 beta-ketoacyl-ACP synthase III [Bacteroidales bacterium]HPZ36226.1 beta-ketoacyl-ACP synthase III [Bacteroidales bacterium]HQD34641.1 beta-ketoacyl-ACP synthase III [Bacteroidales bacterium]HXK91566.1 beta-ketoacyl-ACP synthase III [Bacteroidales bacterium]
MKSMPRAIITGVAGALPDYILTNEELSRMVDTTDEWIMTRIGIKERRILKESGKGTSDIAKQAIEKLFEKTNTSPDEIEFLLCATVTPDHQFPATANIIADKVGIKNAFHFDMNAGCSSFLYALAMARAYIEAGHAKKILLVGADKMSSITDYTDRTTCPIFGDGAGAVLVEAYDGDDLGIIDMKLQSDGVGRHHLYQKAGGSVWPASLETVKNREHFIYQEGQAVFKWAVSKMADVSVEIMQRNNLTNETLNWLVPHQANIRIIEAVAHRMKLPKEKVMINIERYGNTTSATLPLCLMDYEHLLKKGDNIILATFGAGFTWGAMYLKWAYDGDKFAKK